MPPVTYVVDPSISQFQVQAFSTGLLSALGHNPTIAIRGVSGVVRFRDPGFADATAHLRVDSRSLALLDQVSESDRRDIETNMHRDVLESDRFPQIDFRSTAVELGDRTEQPYVVRILGDLSLHGQTRPTEIYAQVALEADMLRAFGEFRLRQTDFDIRRFSFAGGTLKLKDEVSLHFDLLARRERDGPDGGL